MEPTWSQFLSLIRQKKKIETERKRKKETYDHVILESKKITKNIFLLNCRVSEKHSKLMKTTRASWRSFCYTMNVHFSFPFESQNIRPMSLPPFFFFFYLKLILNHTFYTIHNFWQLFNHKFHQFLAKSTKNIVSI